MNWGSSAAVAVVACALVACGQSPIKPAANHLTAADEGPPGSIPPPVQVTPLLPKPKAAARPETYSVVVNNVRVQELLFALARDARLQIDIDPNLTGTVTLNAIDQTLPQLLSRISRQADMRYELDGETLVVMRDTPFLRAYKIDYVSATRNVKMQSVASTQFGSSAQAQGPTATGATSSIEVAAQNTLWESIVQNVKDILRETDKIIPTTPSVGTPLPGAPGSAPAAPSGAAAASPQPPIAGGTPAAPAPPSTTYQEAAAVIANRESGVLYVRATAKQHERVQEFVDQVMAGVKRQVLIEATVAEVQLRNEYQRGITWERLRATGQSGVTASQGSFSSFSPTFTTGPFTLGFLSGGSNITVALKLLEQFGDVRVLSSPKLSVLNNQTAILRVTRDIIYFTIVAAQGTVTASGSGTTVVSQPTFNTTPTVAAEGFMMAVLPQINATDAVVLNVRPTIRRQVDSALDPNPALRQLNIENRIPVFETREFDSILRLQSGQTGVLAGLMQDIMQNTDSFIPGIRNVPILGDMLSNRSDLSTKTELVIFLRATVIQDPSMNGDFASFRNQLPGADFFSKPNPGVVAPLVGPDGQPRR